ncbi:MAG: DUF721 domain-containing protein [Candidatus Eremiobacteraeota bacterium]|nr:DUF721 domain-containing protein [Candidatus Eremiobacteraeota bacterium]
MLTRLGEALERWSPASDWSPRDPLALLTAGWGEIAGADVAKHTRPTRLIDGTLTVTTRSSAWSHQLSLLSEEILAAVRLRLPAVRLAELRFRVGNVPTATGPRNLERSPAIGDRPVDSRQPAASAREALKRFRDDVAETQRAKRAAGWNACTRCSALIAPSARALCSACQNALDRARADEVARLLYEAPWLGYAGTSALVGGLRAEDYEAIRTRTLAAWWETLSRARAAKRTSPDGRERSIASSYVILRTALAPEAIAPATVRNVLGDELHDLIYGMEQTETNVE